MTTERKILVAIGSLLIAGMIAIACFSLGVYVGKQGWTLVPPSLAGPQQTRPGGGQPQPGQPGGGGPQPEQPGQPQPNAPAEQQPKPTLIGVVRRVDDRGITLHAEGVIRPVAVTERTRYAWGTTEGEVVETGLEDVEVGKRVAVFGSFSPDGRTLIADAVVILPPR
jgi:hypothetical protein